MTKKILTIASILLIIVTGCQDPFNQNKVNDLSVTVSKADLSAFASQNTLGVYSTNSANYCFGIKSISATKQEAVFIGSISGKLTAAYLPYRTGVGSDLSKATMSLDQFQSQSSDSPDDSYALYVSTTPEGSVKQGYRFKMKQKFALVRLMISPNKFLSGTTINKVSLKSPQRELAGIFTLNLKDENASLEFSASAADSVVTTLKYLQAPALGESAPVYMYINPAIATGDSLWITVYTAKGEAFIRIKSDFTAKAGDYHTVVLDIPSLVEQGKASIPADIPMVENNFTELTDPGVYNIADLNNLQSILVCKSGTDQYSYGVSGTSQMFRVQNLRAGNASQFLFASAKLGEATTMTCTGVNTPSQCPASSNVRLIKTSDTIYWYEDETNHIGYIIPVK